MRSLSLLLGPPFSNLRRFSSNWHFVACTVARLLLGAACCGGPSSAIAQFGPVLPQPLNSNAAADSGDDFNPRVATDTQGVWVSVWSSREDLGSIAGTDADILVARSTNNGATWTVPQLLNSNGAFDSEDDLAPQIQTDRSGRWIAAWHSSENLGGTLGSDPDILFSVSTDDGVTWSPVRPLNADAASDSRADSAVALESGGSGVWMASWQASGGGTGADQEVWFARSVDDGVTWSMPAPLNSNAASDEGNDFGVTLASNQQGTWIAAWSSTGDLGGTAKSHSDIVFARSVDNGLTWSAPAFFDPFPASDDGEDFHAQIATDRQGRWVVVWESGSSLGGTIGSDQDILFVRSTDNGISWSAPAALTGSAAIDSGLDSFPVVTTDSAGVWVVAWHSNDPLHGAIGPDQDLLAAYSTDHGATWLGPFPLNSTAAHDSGDDTTPHLATDESGNWLVVWSSKDPMNGALGNDDDVFAGRRFSPVLWSRPDLLNSNASTDSGNDFQPRIAADRAGNWIAVWMSFENLNGTAGPDLDILFSRSTNNGVTWSPPAVLNSNANSDSGMDRDPRIATDGQGRWIVVWASNENLNGQTGTDGDILFSVSTNVGTTWSAPAPLNSNATTDATGDFNPDIATDGAGNWVVVWGTVGLLGSDFDTLVSRSTDGGATWSPLEPLNTNAASDDGDDFEPVIATSGGQWIAVWMSNSDLAGLGYNLGVDDDLLVAYSNDHGRSWSSPRPLNSNAATDAPGEDDYFPQIATDGSGHWIVVWESQSTLGGTLATNLNVLYTVSTNNGLIWSPVAALNQKAAFDAGDDQRPQIAVDPSGRWVALWHTDEAGVGGQKGSSPTSKIAVSVSTDKGATWSPPGPLNALAFLEDLQDINGHLAVGASGVWGAVWSSASNLLGADFDVRVATAFLPGSGNAGRIPLPALHAVTSGMPPNNLLLTWTGGAPPFQVQSNGNPNQIAWLNAGGAICDRAAMFPLSGARNFFRVLSQGDSTRPPLDWLGDATHLQGALDAVAQTIFVDGFGIDEEVNVLVSGALPITVQRTVINNSLLPVASGYSVRAQLQGWTFVTVGGQAGYVEGSALQLVFDCQTTNTPALMPGETADIAFVFGGPDCPPLAPLATLPCGLYRETMTIDAPGVVLGLCTNGAEVQAGSFLFVNDPNQVQIAATLNPDSDPNVGVSGTTALVFALPEDPVRTHQLNITTTTPGTTYFVRARSPITGPQAPTIGGISPAIPQSPSPPLRITGPSVFSYNVTVVPTYNGIPSCNQFGLPSSYWEKVNTTLTAITTNGCSIAQESILATGIYECNF